MKKPITTILSFLFLSAAFSQPVLRSDSLHTGLNFDLYSLTGVSTSSLQLSGGANLTWNFTSASATKVGTAALLRMDSTPYASQYPDANFAIRLSAGTTTQFSLFKLSSAALEEVANNVGTANATTFTNYRTALSFPATYGQTATDTYQKSGQAVKTIMNHYDAYGTVNTSVGNYNMIVRIMSNDNGDTSAGCWNVSPMYPMFQVSSSGVTLWKLTGSTTGVNEVISNQLFDMFPNPAANEISIINKEPLTKVEIYNLAGQLQFVASSSVIDISGLIPGIYFIKAYAEDHSMVQKFVKQ